ncbi:unnamed protein product, partial [Heterobilharzia americana]
MIKSKVINGFFDPTSKLKGIWTIFTELLSTMQSIIAATVDRCPIQHEQIKIDRFI